MIGRPSRSLSFCRVLSFLTSVPTPSSILLTRRSRVSFEPQGHGGVPRVFDVGGRGSGFVLLQSSFLPTPGPGFSGKTWCSKVLKSNRDVEVSHGSPWVYRSGRDRRRLSMTPSGPRPSPFPTIGFGRRLDSCDGSPGFHGLFVLVIVVFYIVMMKDSYMCFFNLRS